MSFRTNDGKRPSLLDKGRALSGETDQAPDDAYAREVAEQSRAMEAFDWEILRKRAARLEEEEQAYRSPEPARRPWWRALWLVPALAVAAAVLLFVRPEPGVRAKGDCELEFMVLDDGEIRPGIEGEQLSAGDQIQFTYRAPGLDSLVLLSVDGEGNVTVFQPEQGADPLPIIPGEKHVLDGSIILDDALGPEIFVAVFAPSSVEEATELASTAWDRGGSEAVEALEREDPAVAAVRINKD